MILPGVAISSVVVMDVLVSLYLKSYMILPVWRKGRLQ